MTMYRDVEIRKLPTGFLCRIADILETDNDWKKVMSLIPVDNTCVDFELKKYNNEHMRLIEDHAKSTGRKCAEILFDEWGTSGRIRPTLTTLKKVVLKAEIYRAADEIAQMLQEPPPSRPKGGPAAAIDTDVSLLLKDESMEQKLNSMESIQTDNFSNYTNKIDNRDQAIFDNTTVQMKSASDLIEFSTKINTTDIPNISALQSLDGKTTTQMKSDTDLIKFSRPQLPTIYIEDLTQSSVNIPDLSAIINSDSNTEKSASATITMTQTESSAATDVTAQSIQLFEDIQPESSFKFQTSFPNLDFTDSANSGIDSQILHDTNLIHFDYSELETMTNKFSGKLFHGPDGPIGKIGSGGFGEVFVGFHPRHGHLAVKKAHNQQNYKPDVAIRTFNAEVKYLSQFKHKNIVPILGFSIGGPALCIVCEYIDGGSLQEKIKAKVLNETQRINIMLGTAEGLKYLHRNEKPEQSNDPLFRTSVSDTHNVSKKNNFIHGDVKSANILLTKDCIPKLCDFGLAKQFEMTFITSTPMGTSAYMAPEGHSGTITQKNDIYSYGIVLLELLTGLRPIIENKGERINIKNYIEETCTDGDIAKVLDPVVKKWTKAEDLYNLAKYCLEKDRKIRPTMDEVCDILCRIQNE